MGCGFASFIPRGTSLPAGGRTRRSGLFSRAQGHRQLSSAPRGGRARGSFEICRVRSRPLPVRTPQGRRAAGLRSPRGGGGQPRRATHRGGRNSETLLHRRSSGEPGGGPARGDHGPHRVLSRPSSTLLEKRSAPDEDSIFAPASVVTTGVAPGRHHGEPVQCPIPAPPVLRVERTGPAARPSSGRGRQDRFRQILACSPQLLHIRVKIYYTG